MTLKIIHKNNTSAGQAPASGDLDIGEIAVNSADAKLYTKDNDGAVQEFISKFEQTGSGAVKRTVESKLQDVVSVKDFGAVGDGVTDDTAAIQAAVLAHSHVFFPQGTYRVTSTITYNTAGSCLFGPDPNTRDGAIINFEQDAICFDFTGYSARFYNLSVIGPRTGNDIAIKAARTDSNTDDVDPYVVNCTISNCTLGVQVIGRALAAIENVFATSDTCIDLQWPTSGTSATTTEQGLPLGWRATRIFSNRAHSCGLFLQTSGSDTDLFRGVVLSSNQMDIGERFFSGGIINSTISDNVVELSNSTIMAISQGGSGLVISGNVFSGTPGDDAQSPAHCIEFQATATCNNTLITGNRISSTDDHGIVIESASNNLVITDNTIEDVANTVATAACIRINGAATSLVVCNNTYAPSPGTKGLVVTGTLANSVVAGNTASAGVSLMGGPYTDSGDNVVQLSTTKTNSSSSHTIATGGTDRVVFGSSGTNFPISGGAVVHGTWNDDGGRGLRIRSVGGAAERGLLQIKGSSTVAANTTVFEHYAGGTDAADRTIFIATNGDIYNDTGTYGTISDLKFKKEVVDASEQWEDIKALRFVNYKLDKDIESDPENAKTLLGLVAQEVEQVSPGLVANNKDLDSEGNETGDTTKTLKLSVLFLKTAKALQEAIFKIEKLEEELSKLKHVT